MKDLFLFILYSLAFGVACIFLGWGLNDVWEDVEYERQFNGFNLRNGNMTRVNELQDIKDPYGHWVCVNVRGMEYEKAVEVCNHEVGHEIFAGVCETNITKCMGVLK